MAVHRWLILAALGLALGLVLILGPVNQGKAQAYEPEEQRLLELINGYRETNGLAPLVASETLSTAATRHSEDMAAYGFLDHVTKASSYYPEGSRYQDRLAQEGYPVDSAYTAENIGLGYTAEEPFNFWSGSRVHNANLLDPTLTEIGIGQSGSYWAIDLGSGTVL